MLNVAYVNFWPQNTLNVQDYWVFEFIKNNIDANCVLITNLNDAKHVDILIKSLKI
jgi:hypothetical protein